jgi:tRNA-dihydrouridine synthase
MTQANQTNQANQANQTNMVNQAYQANQANMVNQAYQANQTNQKNTTFWQELATPILGLSPMDGVTDHPFRHIQKKYGQPALIYTEFTSVEGVCHGANRLLTDFLYDETQRPVIAQIYGTTPDFFRQTATVLCELGFDGIDINMGCPAKNVAHSGAGAALIKNPKLATEILKETKAGVDDYYNGKRAVDCANITEEIAREVKQRHALLPETYQNRHLDSTAAKVPVSVKTRVGFDEKVVEWWISTLLEHEPAAICVHGRTLKQQYSGQADWDEISKGVSLCAQTKTRYLGNGDVHTYEQAVEKCNTYGVDGVLIGRASFGNPFIFRPENQSEPERFATASQHEINTQNVFEIAVEHAKLFEKTYANRERYSFLPMRKHLGWYIKAIPQASEIRQKIYQTNNSQEVVALLSEYGLLDQAQQ